MRAIVVGVLLFIGASMDSAAADLRRVLLLHAFGHAYSPWSDMAASFRSELIEKSSEPVDVFEISLDMATTRAPENEGPFVEYIRSIIAGRRLDLVVPIGAPAAYFVQRHRAALFSEVPVLIVGAEARRVPEAVLAENDKAVLLDIDLRAYAANILGLLPTTSELAVVIGNTPVERYWGSEFRRATQSLSDRLKVVLLDGLTFSEMLKRAAGMPEQSAILWYLLSEDAAGVPYAQDRALELMREAATVPVFGVGDYQLGRGIVGGPLLQSAMLGQAAAAVALRILRGDPSDGPKRLLVGFGPPMYDWRELRRWEISEALLPPGSIVRFREPTVWERYFWQIILVLIVLLLQAALIAGLLYQRRLLRQAEQDVRHRASELAYVNRRIVAGQLSASIAHEINQPLAAIVSSGNAGLRWLTAKTPDFEEVAASLKRIVSDGHRAAQIVENVRAMFKRDVQKKVPAEINRVVSEVLDLMRSEFDGNHVSVKVVYTQNLPNPVVDRVQLQQVIINLLRNAIDSMRSTTGRERILRLRTEANEAHEVLISIEDAGMGFDPRNMDRLFEPFFTTKPDGMGMGLSICRSIAEAHGGRLLAAPGRPHGAIFEIALPTVAAG